MIAFLVVLAILFAVVVIVSAPLREARRASEPSAELADLDAAREAKYREIRDAELDRATGKLSEADFHAIDGQLRTEALEILDRIEQLSGRPAASDPAPDG
jgi:hypothetical protein